MIAQGLKSITVQNLPTKQRTELPVSALNGLVDNAQLVLDTELASGAFPRHRIENHRSVGHRYYDGL
jgi:hypothetical protein